MLYDILLIGIVALSVIVGYKKGAAKTILSMAAIIVAVVLSVIVSRMLSTVIYDAFFKESLQNKVESALENGVVGSVADTTVDVVSALPGLIVGAMSYFGMPQSAFEDYCCDAISQQETAAAVVITEKLSPVVTGLIALVLSIVLFIGLYFLLRLLIKPVSKIFKLPIIRKPDSFLGGLIGFVKGIVWILVFATLIKLIIPFIPSQWSFLSEDAIEKSYIFSYVYSGGLLSNIKQFVFRIG